MRLIMLHALVLFLTLPIMADEKSKQLSDDEIRQVLIERSIRQYQGSCPCPFYRDRAGRKCGKRSAWSKPGGAEPLCYKSDVSDQLVKNYRRRLVKDS
ncbi:hypothetical protein [Pleionea sp. CnH1-48]|uniref:hypothetical protein n=1 Tax=Pleionea sp. CnH1-48 TaxID=2954494 RepID=UPI00209762E9|nr:hypothetical protein [Pleionea sp. CnH1-48]MCO7227551.1 hypothetical protein [Pleionea sp. CnH1-48]